MQTERLGDLRLALRLEVFGARGCHEPGLRLTQTGLVATTRTEYLQAKREAEVAESLGLHGGMSRNDAALAKDKAAELETRYGIEQQRLALMTETIDSQLAVQRSQVDRMRAVAEFQQNVLRSLQVRAGDSGV